MNGLRTVLLLVALTAAAAANAAGSYSKQVIGRNESLAAGSRALQLGKLDEGIRLTLLGLKVETDRLDRAKGFSNLCAGYAGVGEYEQALAACEQALELNSRGWRVHNNHALALLGVGRTAEAWRALKTAVALNPDSPRLRQTRAWLEARAPHTVIARNP